MTTSVSDAELASLLADLGLAPAPTTTPAPAARCTVTDLLNDQCAHCRPAPPRATRSSTKLGPWISASYRGECSGCGGRFGEGDRIRADGDGGWLGDCCGDVDDSPAVEQAKANFALAGLLIEEPGPPPSTLAELPAPATGHDDGIRSWNHTPEWDEQASPPPSTVALMRDVLSDLDASRPRSQQTRLGPSELGTPCQRQIGMKLAGLPRQLPDKRPPWAPMQGTAVHGLMEEALRLHNTQLGRERWLIEQRLHMDDEINGSGDAFDTDNAMVVDWKFVGTTALKDLRRRNIPNHELVKPEYRVQPHLYGYGYERAGIQVRWVRLVFLARSHDYDQSNEWTERYNPDIAIKALDRYYATQDLIKALDLAANPNLWDLVPATPGKPCAWCPFKRVGGPADATGCPGDLAAEAAHQMRGLIA